MATSTPEGKGKRSEFIREDLWVGPYENLLASILFRALQDAAKVIPNHYRTSELLRYHRRRARTWLFVGNRENIGSVCWICTHLNLDIGHIRYMALEFIQSKTGETFPEILADAKGEVGFDLIKVPAERTAANVC